MKKGYYLLLILVFTTSIFPGEAANRLCQCLKEGMETNDRAKKNKCLVMQEEIVKQLKEGSQAHKEFKEEMAVCEKKLASAPYEGSESKTMEQKVEEVCRCSYKSYGNKSERMKCMRMQHEYSQHYPEGSEQRKSFLNQTNSCF